VLDGKKTSLNTKNVLKSYLCDKIFKNERQRVDSHGVHEFFGGYIRQVIPSGDPGLNVIT
jgi:hypothetical protein